MNGLAVLMTRSVVAEQRRGSGEGPPTPVLGSTFQGPPTVKEHFVKTTKIESRCTRIIPTSSLDVGIFRDWRLMLSGDSAFEELLG